MRRRKSGKEIVAGLERQIALAEEDFYLLRRSMDKDNVKLRFAGRKAFKIMMDAKQLLRGLIEDLPAPERPLKQKTPQKLPAKPTLTT